VPLTQGNVLVVDDDPQVCALIRDGLAIKGLDCTTISEPGRARETIRRTPYRVVISDVSMPDINGFELLALVREVNPAGRVILMTGVSSTRFLADALRLGAYDYFQKPFDLERLSKSVAQALRDEALERLSQSVAQALRDEAPVYDLTMRAARAIQHELLQDQASLEAIAALIHAVEAKDPHTRRHSEQVTFYAASLAERAGLAREMVESVRVASLLHDVGKIGVPDSILTKPGPLTSEELREIQKHPIIGERIVEKVSLLACETALVRHHHERWDGAGYPDGLAGEDIPLGARIINLADSIDAMLMERTYKRAFGVDQMLDELRRCTGSQFDPGLSGLAIEWCRENQACLVLTPPAA